MKLPVWIRRRNGRSRGELSRYAISIVSVFLYACGLGKIGARIGGGREGTEYSDRFFQKPWRTPTNRMLSLYISVGR